MDDYAAMSMKELRALAHDLRRQGDLRFCHFASTDILNMAKAELQDRLEGRDVSTVKPVNGGNGNGDLADAIARAIQGKLNIEPAGLDEDRVETLIEKGVNSLRSEMLSILEGYKPEPKEIRVVLPTGEHRDVGRQHRVFETLIKLVSARKNVFMVGPAGSGKTYTAHQVANALSLPFYAISVGLQTTETKLLGYMDASGRYVSTLLRQAYEHGGLFLVDEIDAGNPNVLTALNALLANHCAAFPDGMVDRHPDFVCMAAGNTYGRGADRMYVGRNALDAASLNRFKVVDFDYDEDLELDISPNAEWTATVQRIRAAVFELREKIVVSPRASLDGDLLQQGFTPAQIMDMSIFQGCNQDIKSRVLNHAGIRV